MINGNEDCLAKCEWPASEDIDGRMDGWTGGSVWTDGHCIGHRRRRRRVASATKSECIQRAARFLFILLCLFRDGLILPPVRFYYRTCLFIRAFSHYPTVSSQSRLLSRGGFICAECSPSTRLVFQAAVGNYEFNRTICRDDYTNLLFRENDLNNILKKRQFLANDNFSACILF